MLTVKRKNKCYVFGGAVERGYLLASEDVLMEICTTEELLKLKRHSKGSNTRAGRG